MSRVSITLVLTVLLATPCFAGDPLVPEGGAAPAPRFNRLYDFEQVEALGGGLWQIEVVVHNERAIPSVSAMATRNRLHRLDEATVAGAKVLASGIVDDPFLDKVRFQRHRPGRLVVDGVPGRGYRRLMFVVQGQGTITLAYDSVKAGRIERKVPLLELR